MRINNFNTNYIMTSLKEIYKIASDCTDKYSKELQKSLQDILKNSIDSIIAQNIYLQPNGTIALPKNKQLEELLTNKSKETTTIICINTDMLENALIVAIHEEKNEYEIILSNIIANNELSEYGNSLDYEKFTLMYGEVIANFVLNNCNLPKYIKVNNGKNYYSQEEDRHIFLYKDRTITETDLPFKTNNQKRLKKL